MKEKTALIIGAGPAGLTAAYELLDKTDIKPLIFEMSEEIGGISKTVNYKGNYIDIGGHRFFSKSDRVMDWWQMMLPVQGKSNGDEEESLISYQNKKRLITLSEKGPSPDETDRVMLIRSRLSRIFFLRKFFNYPVNLSFSTLRKLGLVRILKIGFSYIYIRLFPIKQEKSLEDFFINRFGKELYKTFFKDYTEKVWGVPCSEIKPEWGAQRIKGLSITKALFHALKSIFPKDNSIKQKNTETSLIDQFLYPKYGPGHLWQETAHRIEQMGGEIKFARQVEGIEWEGNRIKAIIVQDLKSGTKDRYEGDYVFSTMPVKDLVMGMGNKVPERIHSLAEGLIYRDFITVGLLLKELKIKEKSGGLVPDNWIYIQESDVKVGRLQIFNNWSPYMVKNPQNVWIGLEYFCNEGDDLWSMHDEAFKKMAIKEMLKLGIIDEENILDSVLIRMPKTYPAYFGSYEHFDQIREFLDPFENLYLIGRNGMHKYNNQDHSMLTAMVAVENIVSGKKTKENIWAVNTEEEYHEEK